MYKAFYLDEVQNNIHFYLEETTATVVITGIVHNRRNDAILLDR